MPPSVQDWLPESHRARYVVDVVEGLDLSELERAYAGRGSDAYHPALLLSLLIYGCATGTHSNRKIERATHDSLTFRFIACDQHPDHDTLASFRRRFGAQFVAIFVQVLQVARENQLSRFGTVSLDGTKIHTNASRHSALSYALAEQIEAKLKAEVQELMPLAEAADTNAIPDGVHLSEEIKRRDDRLAAIAQAKATMEARAQALAALKALPDCLNPDRLLADTGYFSAPNVKACDAAKFEPLVAVGRDGHQSAWRERFEESAPLAESATRTA